MKESLGSKDEKADLGFDIITESDVSPGVVSKQKPSLPNFSLTTLQLIISSNTFRYLIK